MEGKELRIGNYLHDRNGNLCKVIELRQDGIYAPAINEAITGLPNKPIEITEDWLLNFGFKLRSDIDGENYEKSGVKILILRSDNIHFFFGNPNTKEKYVHELQNLFYALTGEELTIKS
ncbi:hypothetical protein [Elizabethkingia anophelis]|uniref:hypothetical protein n=1 Tax=Elizabethkingia anophelis TaxID=1117645 RepID=UPI000750AA2D|nr:hypothetical protein [Elizabethkingia anophelis]AQW91321.1 hypothetical protein BBD28_11935 [Elizabethkingia anophelis]KUY14187.1 hypothetical protein ATB94_09315 [Elizabethkingia anophelis]